MLFLVDHKLGVVLEFFDVHSYVSFSFCSICTTMEVARHLIVNGFFYYCFFARNDTTNTFACLLWQSHVDDKADRIRVYSSTVHSEARDQSGGSIVGERQRLFVC